jgi:hypothetical protein
MHLALSSVPGPITKANSRPKQQQPLPFTTSATITKTTPNLQNQAKNYHLRRKKHRKPPPLETTHAGQPPKPSNRNKNSQTGLRNPPPATPENAPDPATEKLGRS